MTEEIIAAHGLLVYLFLIFLVGGLFTPLMAGKTTKSFKKVSFIYTMIFQALATMAAFTGMVALFVGKIEWNLSISVMVVVWILMMFIEIKKYMLIKYANLEQPEVLTLLRSAFVKISIIQLLFVGLTIVLMYLKAQGVISL